ncbi:FHA domain-containing protein [Tahibacter soli]|uniref:FHA domain-containing protein n=1 Tax=Tahibacter soli TaxID=2983605 RepID=A0A9X3YJL3_9GAMM|nr:FHA domain-containing protein [Tahibacter soli]MDC8013477.1 FHA domain-containing protein [Tahibacter soli]
MTNERLAALETIDVTAVDALKLVKAEQDVLSERLAQLEERRGGVADAVYLRVRADYETRSRALDNQAAPLKQGAREQYSALRALLDRFGADHESISLDRQEIELRHQLGEYDDSEYKSRIADLETELAARADALNRAQALKAHFLEAFHSEAELEGAAPPAAATTNPGQTLPPTAPYRTLETDAVASPDRTQAIPAISVPDIAVPPVRPPSETQMMPVLDIPLPPRAPAAPPAAPAIGSTVVMRAARLVPQNAEAGKNSTMLSLKPVGIGADPANELRVTGPGVEPKHAQLTVSMAGYTVVDLGTVHGTRVNAEKVRERLLRDQDVIQIGAARWVFREG